MRQRILIIVNAEWYFRIHWLSMAKAAQHAGFDVIVTASVERDEAELIEKEGIQFIPLRLQRRSVGVISEILCLREIHHILRQVRPHLVHNITVKPVLYGSIMTRCMPTVAVVNSITGLGYVFLREGIAGRVLRRVMMLAYRFAFTGVNTRVMFHNMDDEALFLREGAAPKSKTMVIGGVGVDVDLFKVTPFPSGPPVVMVASRLLWDKGMAEFIDAVRILKKRNRRFRAVLVGSPDVGNPESVPEKDIRQWETEGVVEWWGERDNMPSILAQAHMVVLPSYREGLPTILIEAIAAGRPIVATNVPGCRDVVHHNENGLLVAPKDATSLAEAIDQLILQPDLREKMGKCGRKLAVNQYSKDKINGVVVSVYQDLLSRSHMRMEHDELEW